MALPYPEGAVYFRRTALHLRDPRYNNFDVQNDRTFYTHGLLETTWNYWSFAPWTNPTSTNLPTHPRSRALSGKGVGWGTEFGNWDKTNIMFSNNQDGSHYIAMVSLDNNLNWNEVRDHDRGGPLKTNLNPFPLTNANYMLIDWLTPVRAIYLPLAHQAGPGYEDLCVYLMVDFRLRQSVQMRNGSGNLVSLTFDRERGLNTRHNDVLSFNLKGIYDYLILPQQLRAPGKGLYRTDRRGDELITLWDRNRPSPSGTVRPVTRPFLRMIDLVTVINDNFGVDVTWQPYEHSNWVVDFLVHVTTLALGFVPGVGPLLAVSFSVGMQVIIDPEGFRNQNPLHLAADVVAALISSGSGPKANLPSGHQRSGAMFLVIKSESGEPAEPEPPYVKNRGLDAGTDEGKEHVEQKGDEANLLEEPKAEDQWEESVEHQLDVGEGAAKPGAEPKEQIAEPVVREEGKQVVEQAVEDEPKPKTEEEPDGGGNPVPQVNAKDEENSNEEEKVNEGNHNASQDIETEKEPSMEQTLDSKETSIPNDKTEDEENGVVEPESKDDVDQPEKEKADEGNQIASQDVETEKQLGAEQSVDGKETSIPEHKAEDKEDRVAEPHIEDEVKQPEQEKVEAEENQAAEPNVKDDDKENPEPKIEDETKPAAEPIAEAKSTEIADSKAADLENQPPEQPIEAKDKIADPTASDEAIPAPEPKAEVAEEVTADPKADTSENQPPEQPLEAKNKIPDPTANDEAKPAAEPKIEDKDTETADPKAEEPGTQVEDPKTQDENPGAAEPKAEDKAKEPTDDEGKPAAK